MKAKVTRGFGKRPWYAYCKFCQQGVRRRNEHRAQLWANQHNIKRHVICDICGVDHTTTMADLSHGIIRLLMHAQERITWMEYPISGDNIALRRAGQGPGGLLGIVDWGEREGWRTPSDGTP